MRWLAALLVMAGAAQAECRLALALGLDVSGSVDGAEYRLQFDGLAAALRAPDVQAQILLAPETPVWIAVYEWAGIRYQREVAGWTALRTPGDIAGVADAMRAWTRDGKRAPISTSTAIGAAMGHAVRVFEAAPPCARRTLDLSGDGANNEGPAPEIIRLQPALAGVTINGLVVGANTDLGADARESEIKQLSSYYRSRVIKGPDAFVEVALGFEDYERAMTRKLIRETEALAVGLLGDGR